MELYAPWVVIKIPVMDDKGKKRLGRMDQVRIKKHVCWQPDRLAFRRVAVFVGQPLALPVGKRALAMDRIKTP